MAKSMKAAVAAVCVAILLYSHITVAQDMSVEPEPNAFSGDRALMTAAVLQRLTIWTRPADGHRIFTPHCRAHRHGCEQEIRALVDIIFDVSVRENFDPWLLAGIAWHESGFNPYAESSEGAVGLLQILRRSPWSHGLDFVHRRRYREACRREIGSCQREIVERSVSLLHRVVERCGTIRDGLRMYNSGRCDGPRRYPRNVFAAQRDLLNRAMVIAENSFTDPERPQDGPVYFEDGGYCSEADTEEYWCSDRSLMCHSYEYECTCESES